MPCTDSPPLPQCSTGERRRAGRQWLWWLLTVLWAAEIFGASTSRFGSFQTASVLASLMARFHIDVSPAAASLCNTVFRKGSHVVEYMIFTALLYRAATGGLAWRPLTARWCMLAAAAYSVTDECHQMFVPGRGASILDCCFDVAGSAVAMLVLYRRLRPSRAAACGSAKDAALSRIP